MSKPNRSRRRLPAIREESPFKTNRIPVHIIPPGASLQRIQGGSMLIQNLPDEPSKPPPKVTPSNRYHDSVDQIVSDYLHFSKYGEVIPVSNGFAPNVCPCCMDRNRENVQMLKQRNRAPPEEPDPNSLMLPETGFDNPDPSTSGAAAGGVSGSPRKVGFSNTVDIREVSPRKGQRRPTVAGDEQTFSIVVDGLPAVASYADVSERGVQPRVHGSELRGGPEAVRERQHGVRFR
ncbi:uncharacterized protein [Littorina saxatilis]|uniref:uncharacterized protein isoform X1 n=1 Tax=Littorina saxatilis TaxID=31220 RepID=UPI0038B5E285